MKRRMKWLLVLCMSFVSLCALSACGGLFESHVHFYNATATLPTCTEKGYTTYTCECGDTYVGDETPAMGHNYVDKVCTGCGDVIMHSQGLEYADNGDGTCRVTGLGACTDTKVIIPKSYNGKRVTSIGSLAFYDCDSLTSVVIGNGVTSIGDFAFDDCDSLTSVVIGDSVTSIGDRAFSNCERLMSITIPDSVTSIGSWAFNDCSSLTSVVIPDSVTSIGDFAFCCCSSLTQIVIPSSVTSIGYHAFSLCSHLTIYCEAESQPIGWSSDWKGLYVDERRVYWYSEEPEVNGWRYVDGVVTKWLNRDI